MTQKLKPCPFCNGEAEDDSCGAFVFIRCKKCHARTSDRHVNRGGYESALLEWNTRHEAKREFVVNPAKQP